MQTIEHYGESLSPALVEDAERFIRDLAATVITEVTNRRNHPSYGYTKGMIRSSATRLDGAIRLYMLLTRQASNPIPRMVAFADAKTQNRVHEAWDAVQSINHDTRR